MTISLKLTDCLELNRRKLIAQKHRHEAEEETEKEPIPEFGLMHSIASTLTRGLLGNTTRSASNRKR